MDTSRMVNEFAQKQAKLINELSSRVVKLEMQIADLLAQRPIMPEETPAPVIAAEEPADLIQEVEDATGEITQETQPEVGEAALHQASGN